jgi:hypothetical protein
MGDRPKIQIDYSSPDEEQAREKKLEDERREALENYNDSTYGERHPFLSPFVWFAVMAAVLGVIFYLFPRSIARPLTFCTIVLVTLVRHMLDR